MVCHRRVLTNSIYSIEIFLSQYYTYIMRNWIQFCALCFRNTQRILFILTERIIGVPYQYCTVILQGNQIYIPKIFMYFLLWTFAKLWNATISFVMSVCPFVCREHLNSLLADFHEIWYYSNFWNSGKFKFH